MSNDPVQTSASQANGTAPSAPDERDAVIGRLERSLAQERQNAAALRTSVEELQFKLDILEKSYSKQLADARDRRDAAENELAAERARAAQLGTGGEDTLERLERTRVDLERMTAERDNLRSRLAGSQRGPHPGSTPPAGSQSGDAPLTIDDLLATSRWRVERRSGGEGHLNAQVPADQEAPVEMISPELVFTKGRKRDEDS